MGEGEGVKIFVAGTKVFRERFCQKEIFGCPDNPGERKCVRRQFDGAHNGLLFGDGAHEGRAVCVAVRHHERLAHQISTQIILFFKNVNAI